MRRLANSLVLLVVVTATALAPGAVAFAQTRTPACPAVDLGNLTVSLNRYSIVVIGTVREEHGGGLARIEPEAYLKGSASGEPIRPRVIAHRPGCASALLTEGRRVLAFLVAESDGVEWPTAGQVFWLEGGRAMQGGDVALATTTTETELVSSIRSITNQYAVPAASRSEGAGVDWLRTVLPVTGVTLVVLVIALYLMRIWHRIDPS